MGDFSDGTGLRFREVNLDFPFHPGGTSVLILSSVTSFI